MTDTDTVERHKDTERNLILNRTLSDLDDIINGHDPEIDTSINNGVWDRLDKMALEIEARAIAALPPAVPQPSPERTIILNGADEADGFWASCTGCHETNEGHETGYYPYSDTFKCFLGGGCSECGGLGAVWDDTDYADMAEYLRNEPTAPDPVSVSEAANTRPHGNYAPHPRRQTMRDKLADICDEEIQSDNPSCYVLAAAIIAALPDMVQPLEWDNATRHGQRVHAAGDYAIIKHYPRGHTAFCIQYRGLPMNKENYPILSDAQTAVHHHRTRRILSAFGITGET